MPLIGQKAGVPVPKTAGPGELAVLPAPEHPAAAPEQTQNAGLPTPNIPDAASPSAPKAAMADAGKGSTRPVAAPVCDAPSSSEEEQQELVLPPYRIHCSADGVSSIEDTVTHEVRPLPTTATDWVVQQETEVRLAQGFMLFTQDKLPQLLSLTKNPEY